MIKLLISAKTKGFRDRILEGVRSLRPSHMVATSLEQMRDQLIYTPDIDIVIDQFANLNLCKKLAHDYPRVRFIVIDEDASVERAVQFMQAGVDDYIPIDHLDQNRLHQAIDIALDRPNPRRTDPSGNPAPAAPEPTEDVSPNGVLYYNGIELNCNRNQASYHGKFCNLTPTESRLLQVLMEAEGETVTYEQLALRAQDLQLNLLKARQALSAHMSNLRTKLRHLDIDDYIENVHNVGYYIRSLEDTLTHERVKLSIIAQHAADIIVYVDGDDIVRFVSPSVTQHVDRDPNQFIDQPFDLIVDTVHDDDKEAFLYAFRDARTGGDQTVNCRGIHPISGEHIWFEVVFSALDDGSGGIVYVARNIDDRVQMQEQLRVTNARYQRSLQAGMVGVWESDLVTNRFYVDPGYRELFGLEQHEPLTHEQATACVHPDDQQAMMDNLWDCIDSGLTEYENEHRIIDVNGQVHWVLARGHIVRDAQGQALRVNGTDIDITVLKEAEATIAAQSFILESVSEAIVMTSADGIIQTWSKGAEHIYGYSREEAIGQAMASLLRVSYLNESYQDVQAQLMTEGSWSGQMVLRQHDEQEIYLQVNLETLLDDNGLIRNTLSIARDITAEYTALQDLRLSEAQLRLVTDNLQDIITQIGPDGIFTYISPSLERVVGYSADKVMRMPVQESINLLHPDDQARVADYFEALKAMKAGQTMTAILRMRHADGHYVWLENRSQVIIGEDGRIISFIGSTRDVSDRQEAENALRQSEVNLRAITDNSRDIIMQIDVAGSMQYVNPAFFDMLGYSYEVGFNFEQEAWDSIIHPDDREGVNAWRANIGAGGDAMHIYRVQHADGHYLWLENQVVQVFNDTGDLKSLISIQRDITQRYQHQVHVQQQAQLLDLISKPIITTDMNGIITYWNKAATELFGWSASEATGQNFDDLLKIVYLHDRSEIIKELNRSRTWDGNGFILHDREGRQLELYAHSSLIVDENDVPTGIVVIYRSSQRAHEEYLMSKMPFVIIEWTSDPDQPERYVSPTVSHFGYDAADFVEGSLRWHQIIHPDDEASVRRQVASARENGDRILHMAYRVLCDDGNVRQVYVRSELFYDDSDDIAARAFIFDITGMQIPREPDY